MSKCVKCGEDDSTKTEYIYGIIEKYHYDSRQFDTDLDFGQTSYESIALVKIPFCSECAKNIKRESILSFAKNICFSILLFIVFKYLITLENGFFDIISFASLIAMVVFFFKGLSALLKNITVERMIKKTLNGKISKEYVLAPDTDEDLDIEDLPYSLEYRERFYYSFINEKQLKKPVKQNAKPNSKAAAINELKEHYSAI